MTKDEIQQKISEYCDINYLKLSKSDVIRINDDYLDELLEVDGRYYNQTVITCQLKNKDNYCNDCGKEYSGQQIITINLKTKHKKCNICKIGDE